MSKRELVLSLTFYLFTINNVDDENGVVKGICSFKDHKRNQSSSRWRWKRSMPARGFTLA